MNGYVQVPTGPGLGIDVDEAAVRSMARAAMSGRFAGKVVLVTGAASGIGRAIALQLASEGARLVVTTRQNQRGLDETVNSVRAAGSEARCRRRCRLGRDDTKAVRCRPRWSRSAGSMCWLRTPRT